MLSALMVLCLMRLVYLPGLYAVSFDGYMPYASLYLPGLYAVSFDVPEL